MKSLLSIITIGLFAIGPLHAQTILLKDGQLIEEVTNIQEFENVFLYERNSRSISVPKDRIQRVVGANGNVLYEFFNRTLRETESEGQVFEFVVNGEVVGRGEWIEEGQFEIVSGSIPDGVYQEYFSSGRIKREYPIQDGKLNGTCREYYASGVVERESTIVNGLENGVSKNYHQDGTIKGEARFEHGLKQGETRLYYESGDIRSVMSFTNGVPDGLQQIFYESGELHTEVEYQNGQKHGMIRQYYETGSEKMSGTFKNGKLEGEVVIYYESGRVKDRQMFRNGRVLKS